ncbi:MAG: oligoendopeptidase F [Anaerolineaceae bacterium]|nr:oligoendopeptidase F [Anaerolineaceae bacterium]
MAKTLAPRSEVNKAETWNAESVFESTAAWETERQAIEKDLPQLGKYPGTLSNGPDALAEWLETSSKMRRRVEKLYFYAAMSQAVETTNQKATAMVGQAGSLYSQYAAAASFALPEMLALGEATLLKWVKDEPRLSVYQHYFEDLFRQQEHVRSGEVEEVLALAGDPFQDIDNTQQMLTAADMKFESAIGSDGETVEVAQGTIDTIVHGADREARRTGWENYADGYLAMKNTLASNYSAAVKRDVFYARARRYGSSLEAALFPYNIPTEVFHNLINTYKKHIPTWHKYWAVRRRALGVDTLHPYDIWAPISKADPPIAFEQAVDWISEGMAPLGDEYVNTLRKGCLEQRWVDRALNQGKTQGAFSYGTYDTHPFIMMSYDDSISALSTLAHELGHSMHTYLTKSNQPVVYGDYSMFAAEVASNFNQAMVRDYLFRTNDDPQFQIALIEEAMDNIHRYFFIMPTLARFELEAHERAEKGHALTAEDLNALMADLFSEGYGSEMHVDRDRVGITWAEFGHLYMNFYVFQYATGISAAHALSRRILDGTPNGAADYLGFLKAGSSLYPVDALAGAGVDMSTPEAVETTFGILAEYVDRLDQLTR